MSAIVLVAESDPFNLRLLSEVCEAAGYTVLTALDAPSALGIVARARPDLLLVDARLVDPGAANDSGPAGLEAVRLLKCDAELATLPVLITTPADEVELRRRGIELGAEDWLVRPYRVFEVHQRIKNALERAKAQRAARTELDVETSPRHAATTQLELTLDYEATRAARYGHPLACMSVALDRTASTGPAETEALIAQLTLGVRASVRVIDHLYRVGDDEIVVVLPETSTDDATVVSSRLRERVRDGSLYGSSALRPGIAIGIAGRAGDQALDARSLLAEARAARLPQRG